MAEAVHAEKVVGLQWNYTTNLYRQIAQFCDLRNAGRHFAALVWLIHLIQGSSKAIQDKFTNKLQAITKAFNILEEKTRATAVDDYSCRSLLVRKRNMLAEQILTEFYPEVSKYLDLRGYAEQTKKKVPEGFSDTY